MSSLWLNGLTCFWCYCWQQLYIVVFYKLCFVECRITLKTFGGVYTSFHFSELRNHVLAWLHDSQSWAKWKFRVVTELNCSGHAGINTGRCFIVCAKPFIRHHPHNHQMKWGSIIKFLDNHSIYRVLNYSGYIIHSCIFYQEKQQFAQVLYDIFNVAWKQFI